MSLFILGYLSPKPPTHLGSLPQPYPPTTVKDFADTSSPRTPIVVITSKHMLKGIKTRPQLWICELHWTPRPMSQGSGIGCIAASHAVGVFAVASKTGKRLLRHALSKRIVFGDTLCTNVYPFAECELTGIPQLSGYSWTQSHLSFGLCISDLGRWNPGVQTHKQRCERVSGVLRDTSAHTHTDAHVSVHHPTLCALCCVVSRWTFNISSFCRVSARYLLPWNSGIQCHKHAHYCSIFWLWLKTCCRCYQPCEKQRAFTTYLM